MSDPESITRAALRRSMLVYTAFLALDVAALAYVAAGGPEGAGYGTLFIVGAVGLLLAFQVWMHARDMASPLAESEGVVRRKWSRADLIIAWQSYYVTVGRRVFRLRPEDHVLLDEGMYVKVVHCPRTLHVVSIREVRDATKAPGA